MIAGRKFGDLEGKSLIIDRGLYGLKSSAARFHEYLLAKLREFEYYPTKADADLWMKDCGTYYSYIAWYVDDVLCFDKNPIHIIKKLQETMWWRVWENQNIILEVMW